jgi:hypothetical protein
MNVNILSREESPMSCFGPLANRAAITNKSKELPGIWKRTYA